MKKTNPLIKKRRKKRLIKRLTIGLFVMIIGIIIFIYKSPIFNLSKINITGLVSIKNESLQEVLKYEIGQNIFTIDYKEMEELLLSNKYIKSIKIKKSSINSLEIEVIENEIGFYSEYKGDMIIINNQGEIVEAINTVEDKNLLKLEGLNLEGLNIGDKISEDEEISIVLDSFYKMQKELKNSYKITNININDIEKISCYIGDVKVILGNYEDIIQNMNLALNAIEQKVITKGYIDMSFDGIPVIKIQN